MDPSTAVSPDTTTTTSSHRQLLATVDNSVDANGDTDVTTDDEIGHLGLSPEDIEANSILEVSIGQAQDHMRSARTPAFEKAQVLKRSQDYFDPELPAGTSDESLPSNIIAERNFHDPQNVSQGTAISAPWTSQPDQAKRSSITRALLGDGQDNNRPRSSSGPTAIMDGIKKLFTDFPSYPGFGSNNKQDNPRVAQDSDSKQEDVESQSAGHGFVSTVQPPSRLRKDVDLERDLQPQQQRGLRPSPLRRSISDHSLYLRRAATGASAFDDTNAYANVADMANPRFKAITDSLADSAIRMPKMPSLSFSSTRNQASRTNSNVTRMTTALNSGTQNTARMQDRDSSQPYNTPQYVRPNDKRSPILTEALTQVTGDVVVMGGYRGSVLRLAEFPHHQLWVPVKVGLGLRKVDLEVGLTHEDEERMEEKIIPSGVLSHIGPIDIARRMMRRIRKCPNGKSGHLRLHDYGYDWRLSPHFLSRRLIKFLEGLDCNSSGTPPEKRGALVIAHSLGGLITRHAVNERPELFSGVVYVGTPQNCANILGPLRNGDDVLLTSRVLTAQVNFTLRTSYALLPEDGRCFMNNKTGEQYNIDMFNPDSWEEYHLSPCINPILPRQPQQKQEQRKSIVGSITDSISSFTPSLPGKRSSWFSTSNTEANTTADTVKDKLQSAAEGIEDSARIATEGVTSPKQEVENSLEPSMRSSSNKPSVATAVTIPKDKAREYLARTLAEVKQFKAELRHVPAHQDANRYPPHALIYGKSVPTVYGAKVPSREAIKYAGAFDDLAFAAGDGVVLASAAQLPAGYRCVKEGRVESDRGHIGLLGDLEGIGQCIAAVVEGRKRGIGLAKAPRATSRET